MKKLIKYVILVGCSTLILVYGITCRTIFLQVRSICTEAQQRFGGDKVDATIALLQSENTFFELKNKAVYALGQIGDKKALPALMSQITGTPCEKPCPKNKYVCQYNLEKAVRICSGGFSLTKWMYRFL